MWSNYPKGLQYSVLPDGLQEKHIWLEQCRLFYTIVAVHEPVYDGYFCVFPISFFRKSLPHSLRFPLFVSAKLTALKSLGRSSLNFTEHLQHRGKEKLSTEVCCLVLSCFALSLWLVSLSNTIEFHRYKYLHPSGFTLFQSPLNKQQRVIIVFFKAVWEFSS